MLEEAERAPSLEGIEGQPVIDGPEAVPPSNVPRVAIAVGKTNDGSEFPAKPILLYPVPLSMTNGARRDIL